MAVTIEGAKLTDIQLTKDAEGMFQMAGAYALMSSTGIVLAKQAVNGYQGMKLTLSPATTKLLHDYVSSVQIDLNTSLGLV